MNMTPTAADPITVIYSDEPSAAEVVEEFADFVALNPAAILYDLLLALQVRGVSMSIVESALAHLPIGAD